MVPEDVVTFQFVLGMENEREIIACKVARDADARLDWVRRFKGENGELSEQFSRMDGKQIGAKKLTWSFEAFLKAVNRRRSLGDWIEHCYDREM
jgi:GH15 family glucan-1,4-alpha-glucosidase